jgi:hypothetical protein
VIPGEHVSQAVRQTQHPLTDRHVRKDVINEVRRPLCHSTPPAPGTDRTSLARERQQMLVTAGVAAKPACAKAPAGSPKPHAKAAASMNRGSGSPSRRAAASARNVP